MPVGDEKVSDGHFFICRGKICSIFFACNVGGGFHAGQNSDENFRAVCGGRDIGKQNGR